MTGDVGARVIAKTIVLLEAAADRCLSLLVGDPARGLGESFTLSDLGLGLRLAAIDARGLLPADLDLDHDQLVGASRDAEDPIALVRAADALTRTVPIEQLPAGSSRVVVAICDLLAEHG
jgi:hypothetical protein